MSTKTRTKKILILGMADGLGGAQTALREFAIVLKHEGLEVAIVAIGDKASFAPELASAVLCTIPLSAKSISGIARKAFCVSRAAWLARKFSPNVFVCVGLAQTANAVARALPASTFKIAQDFIFGRSAEDRLLRSAGSVFDAIGVQAPSMVTALRNSGFSARPVNWLPCFPQAPIEGCVRKVRQTVDSVRLGYFGRIVTNKGLQLILEALADSEFTVPVTLDLWGNGEDASRLTKKCDELGLSKVVSFRGSYPGGQDGARLMCSYDAIVLPSTGCEGLPLILIEAMAYGLPFLATDVGAICDCCEDNPDCILVKPQVDALREGLSLLVRKVVGQELSPERLRQYYALRFSYPVMRRRWRDCLQAPEIFFSESH